MYIHLYSSDESTEADSSVYNILKEGLHYSSDTHLGLGLVILGLTVLRMVIMFC